RPPPPRSAFFPYTTLFRSHDARMMTGRNEVVVEPARPLEHPPELHRAVALDTRVRCLTRRVCVDVRLDDVGLEDVGEVEDIVREDRKSTRLNSSHLVTSYA